MKVKDWFLVYKLNMKYKTLKGLNVNNFRTIIDIILIIQTRAIKFMLLN